MKNFNLGFLFLAITLTACGPKERDRENYGDLSSPAGAIILSNPAQHSAGWGRRDCLLCHNAELNIHQRPGSGFDIEKFNQVIINNGGSAYCITCHLGNGLN